MIDPNFWRDEKVGELDPVSRLIFIGLWTFADDSGVGRANPKLLKADILPYDDTFRVSDFLKSLEKLSTLKLITLYEVEEQNYYYINNFSKYQTINRPTPSNLPLPSETSMNTDSIDTHGVIIDNSVSNHELLTPNISKDNISKVKLNKDNICSFHSQFEIFYNLYPRKTDKKKSQDKYLSILKKSKNADEKASEILTGLKRYIDFWEKEKTDKQFIPHPTTWLNGERWNDELTTTPKGRVYEE